MTQALSYQLGDAMRPYQFSLKQLLLVPVVLCVFLGWWFQPFTVEISPDNGVTTFKYRVRRHWNGARYHYGPIRMFFDNGTMGAESVVYGAPVGSVDLLVDGDESRYWKDDGTEVSYDDWSMFVSLEYLPEKLHGKSLREPIGDSAE